MISALTFRPSYESDLFAAGSLSLSAPPSHIVLFIELGGDLRLGSARGRRSSTAAFTLPLSLLRPTYTFSAFGGTAHLMTEKAEYKYWQSLDVLRRWFRADIDAIMRAVPGMYGAVNARDHVMLVNPGDTEEESDRMTNQKHRFEQSANGDEAASAWGWKATPPMTSADCGTLSLRRRLIHLPPSSLPSPPMQSWSWHRRRSMRRERPELYDFARQALAVAGWRGDAREGVEMAG
ncbi:hypothetical protein C8F01DRAFT_1231875, partial [Mycena amicta]